MALIDEVIQQNTTPAPVAYSGRPSGVPHGYSWWQGRIIGSALAPSGMTSGTGWGAFYPLEQAGASYSDQGLTEVRNFNVWVRRKNGTGWDLVQPQTYTLEGYYFDSDFTPGVGSLPATITNLGGGHWRIPNTPQGRTFHFWMIPRMSYTANAYNGCYSQIEMRAVQGAGNTGGPMVFQVAADWWRDPGAPYVEPVGTNNPLAGNSNWVTVTTDWTTVGFFSETISVIQGDPPPTLANVGGPITVSLHLDSDLFNNAFVGNFFDVWTPAQSLVRPVLMIQDTDAVWSGMNLASIPNSGTAGGSWTVTGVPDKGSNLNGSTSVRFDAGTEALQIPYDFGNTGKVSLFAYGRMLTAGVNGVINRDWNVGGANNRFVFYTNTSGGSGGTTLFGNQNSAGAYGAPSWEATASANFQTTGGTNCIYAQAGAVNDAWFDGAQRTLTGTHWAANFPLVGAAPDYPSSNWEFGRGQTNESANTEFLCIALFDDNLSTFDRQCWEGYWSHRGGTQAQLPSDHPYRFTPPGAPGSAPAFFDDTDTFGTNVVTVSFVLVTPVLYDDTDSFGTAVVGFAPNIVTNLYDDADSFNTAVLSLATVAITPAIYNDTDAFETVGVGALIVAPDLFDDTDVFDPLVVPQLTTITVQLLDDDDAFPSAYMIISQTESLLQFGSIAVNRLAEESTAPVRQRMDSYNPLTTESGVYIVTEMFNTPTLTSSGYISG